MSESVIKQNVSLTLPIYNLICLTNGKQFSDPEF
jgi:hypothetical protein